MTNSIIFQGSSTSSSGGESSCDESRIRKPRLRTAEPRLRTTALNEKLREDCPIDEPGSSDYNSSTGEESCDTVIYVGPDGAISDRELTDNEGPPTRLPLKNSRVSSSTQSLVRKLESIENEEVDDKEESEEIKREVEGSEDSGGLVKENIRKEFSKREEGEGESSEYYTEESCYETEIEIPPENPTASRKRLHDKKVSPTNSIERTREDAKRTRTYLSDSEQKELYEPPASELNTLILPSKFGSNLDLDETMNSQHTTVVIPVQSFPGEEAKLRTRVMSPETSSESSDAESIVMAKVPSFSFLTCEAINDFPTDSISMESLNMEQDLHDYELSCHNGNPAAEHNGNAIEAGDSLNSELDFLDYEVSQHYENRQSHVSGKTTEELIKNCQPPSPMSESGELCYVVEETRETNSEELSYDDSEIAWGKKNADDAIIAEAFCEEEKEMEEDDSERNFTGNETDVLFPELEERLQDVEACASPETAAGEMVQHKPGHRQGSDDSATDSDTDVTHSYTFETPMKTFYRLVPSPQSSSTEDELEDIQVLKPFHSKILSPIPEFPSVESNLNRTSADSQNGSNNRASCSYSIVSVEIDDGNTTVRLEGDKENIPMGNISVNNNKGDLRSLLQKFVAEQLRECEGEKFSSRYVRPAARHPENRRPRPRSNRPPVPLSSYDTSNSDTLLPPLVPQKRTCTETARLISSPKLQFRGGRDYDSDIAPCAGKTQDEDWSSDSSMTAKTEPWCTPSRSVVSSRFASTPRLSSLAVGNMKTSVTFMGSEDENNNYYGASSLERTCVIEGEDMLDNSLANPDDRTSDHVAHKDSKSCNAHYVKANNSPSKRSDRSSVSSVSNFVKLTYCGSELSDTEYTEKADKASKQDKPSKRTLSPIPSAAISVSVERPDIQYRPVTPETPYAPQEEFISRFHDRNSPPRIVYRLSGEFVATIPSDSNAEKPDTQNAVTTSGRCNRQYRLSGEFIATFTTAVANTQSASTLALTSSNTDETCPKSESTEVVWVQNEPVVSAGETTADEMSGPATPVPTRSGKFGRFKFFG